MKNRLLSSVLILFLVLSAAACGSASEKEEPASENPDTATVDFDGYTFVNSTGWDVFNVFDASDDSLTSDLRREQCKNFQELYNCVLVDDRANFAEVSNYYAPYFASGLVPFDLTDQAGTPNPIPDMFAAGMLYPLDTVDGIDFSNAEIYGTETAQKAFTFDGHLYVYSGGTGGAIYGFLAYNGGLVSDFGMETPQELYEQKKWTFDTFEEYLPAVTDKTEGIWGLSVYCDDGMLPLCAVFANGGEVFKQDTDGKYRFSLGSTEATNALDWVTRLEEQKTIVHDAWEPRTFYNGKSTLYLGRSWSIQKAINEESSVDSFYYIPFPYGPNAEYGKTSASYISEEGGIAVFDAEEPEMTVQMLDLWGKMSLKRKEEEPSWESNYFSYESYQHRQYATFDEYHIDYFSQIGKENYGTLSSSLLKMTQGSMGISEGLGKLTDRLQQAIDSSLNLS